MSKNCSVCGALTDDSTVYCYACGSRFEEKKPEPEVQPQEAPIDIAKHEARMLGIGEEEPVAQPVQQQTNPYGTTAAGNTYGGTYGTTTGSTYGGASNQQTSTQTGSSYQSSTAASQSGYQQSTFRPTGFQFQDNSYEQMSTGAWVGTILISCLGIIGIIFLAMWAFGSDTKEPKRTYAKAMLIIMGISTVLSLFLYGFAFAYGMSSAYM